MPTATDNCSVNTPVLTGGIASGFTFSSGTTTVSYEVTDRARVMLELVVLIFK
ncbi:MAG: hypothetical protein R2784_01065 [Saprospiraceae bacterium]